MKNRLADRRYDRVTDSIIHYIQEGIIITDDRGIVEKINPAFTKMTGYLEKDIVGQHPRMLRSGRHLPDFYREVWRKVRETGTWQGEIWNRNKDGEIRLQALTISRVDDVDGTLSGYVGIFEDITERRHLEKHMQPRVSV
jgi:PAS domain S-box-containing protein